MTQHCLNKSPDSPAAQRLLAQLRAGEAVVLLGPAVRLAAVSHPALTSWLSTGAQLYALEEDLRAYAVGTVHVDVQSIDYAGWVKLSEAHSNQRLWR